MFWALGIIFVASLSESIMGFGGGLIAIPLLSLLVGVKDAVILCLVMQALVGLIALRARGSLDWVVLRPMLVALLLGTALGTCFLGVLPESVLRLGLAGFILLFLVKSTIWSSLKLVPSGRRRWGVLAGSVSGLIQGMLGTGGPPLVIYFNETMESKETIRTALLLFLVSSNLVRVTVAIPTGLFRAALMPTILWSIPCVLGAMWLGHALHHGISEKLYRRSILVLLAVSCASLLLKSFSP